MKADFMHGYTGTVIAQESALFKQTVESLCGDFNRASKNFQHYIMLSLVESSRNNFHRWKIRMISFSIVSVISHFRMFLLTSMCPCRHKLVPTTGNS